MPRNPLMNTMVVTACLGLVAMVGWRAGAGSTEYRAIAAPSAVALVDVERALNELDELTALNEALGVRVKDRQDDLDTLLALIQGLQADLKELPDNSTEKRRTIRAQLFEKTETANARAKAYQSLINIEKGEIIRPLYLKLLDAVGEVSGKEGYDLVLFDNRQMQVPQDVQGVINDAIQSKSILFASDSLDITDQIIVLMNNKYKASVD
jgi:Skp family chaperone for outer membrane proteins